MIKIKYDFKNVYDPATTINNIASYSIQSSTMTLSDSGTTQYKIFKDMSLDCFQVSADDKNITIQNCLFVNCQNVLNGQNHSFGSLKFVNCTFYNCNTIADTGTATVGTIEIDYGIINLTPYLKSKLAITVKRSCIQKFFGYTGTIDYQSTNIYADPSFIDIITTDIPYSANTDGVSFVLMSKSRGYDYNSKCVTENTGLTYDIGCYLETRDSTPAATNSEWVVDYIPKEKKTVKKLNFSSFEDINGIARSYHDSTKKTIQLEFDYNGLSEDDKISFIAMDNAKDNYIEVYPDSDNATRYLKCRILKKEDYSYSKMNDGFFDKSDNKLYCMNYKGFSLLATIEEEVGTEWR